MGKFIQFLKEALSLKPDDKSEEIVNKIDGLKTKLTNATLNGEDHWHLCWERKKDCQCDKCSEGEKDNVD